MSAARSFLSTLLAVVLLLAVGAGDYWTGPRVSFTLLYLLPVGAAIWGKGRWTGVMLATCASIVRLGIMLVESHPPITAMWNTGMFFGTMIAFGLILDHVRPMGRTAQLRTAIVKSVGFGVVMATALAGFGVLWESKYPAMSKPLADGEGDMFHSAPVEPVVAGNPVAAFRETLTKLVPVSRSTLLGSRDPNDPSCVTPVLTGEVSNMVPASIGDYDGGPGTKLAALLYLDRQAVKKPSEDFAYMQGRLKRYLTNQKYDNDLPSTLAERAYSQARAIHEAVDRAGTDGPILQTTGYSDRSNWLGFCLTELEHAADARDLAGTKRWADELQTAAFALADLHRWLGFLLDDYLTALEFQAKCASLFPLSDAALANAPAEATLMTPGQYDPRTSTSFLPGGLVILHGVTNFYEVEHRAERLFSSPADREVALRQMPVPDESAIGVPPNCRPAYLKLRAVLSPANAATWDTATHTPYEYTYLVNMLDRATKAQMVPQLAVALKDLDTRLPHARLSDLMGLLMYRGHSFAGVEWSDRFLPKLVDTAGVLTGLSDEDALTAACKWTNNFYKRPTSSYGVTLTLRDALQESRLDCVRATDMIGALFRNGGHSRFGHVRWVSENAGHSVAAGFIPGPDGKAEVLLADGLNPSDKPEFWPNAYFHGHQWPATMQNNPTPYAAELYLRGLDNYIWAEGYIIRGPNAGLLVRANVPWSINRQQGSTQRVFNGPYPN